MLFIQFLNKNILFSCVRRTRKRFSGGIADDGKKKNEKMLEQLILESSCLNSTQIWCASKFHLNKNHILYHTS